MSAAPVGLAMKQPVARRSLPKSESERQRRRAHHGRDEQCLGQQLTHDAPAACPNGQPCRELPLTGECPRQLQVSDVRTGEQQNCQQATEYQRERRDAHGAAWLIERPGAVERDDARLALRCRIELRHQDGQLGSRRLAETPSASLPATPAQQSPH